MSSSRSFCRHLGCRRARRRERTVAGRFRGGLSRQPGAKQPQQKPPTVGDVTLTGVIDALQPNGLKIKASKDNKSKDRKDWFVTSKADTEFTIRGTAAVDYVRKGQLVEFSGQIVEGEKVADKPKEDKIAGTVDDLTIVSRKRGSATVKKGSAKDAAGSGPSGDRIAAPKADADSETTLTVPDDDAKTKAGDGDAPAAKPKAAAGGPKTKFVGKIAACDEKSITVTSGQRTIHLDLAEVPTINVELADPKLVQDPKDKSKYKIEGTGATGRLVTMTGSDLVGSKIMVHGRGVESKSNNDKECLAKSIEVTLMAPLTGSKPASAAAKKSAADDK